MDQKSVEHLKEVSDTNLEMHRQTKDSSHQAMNNILFVVSSGAFVLSISFIGNIKSVIAVPWVLIASWAFLITAIALNFAAHFFMIKQSNRQIKLINKERYDGFPNLNEFNNEVVKKDEELKEIVRKGNQVNKAVLTFLSLGLVALIVFGAANLLEQNKVNKHDSYGNYYSHTNPRESLKG